MAAAAEVEHEQAEVVRLASAAAEALGREAEHKWPPGRLRTRDSAAPRNPLHEPLTLLAEQLSERRIVLALVLMPMLVPPTDRAPA